MIIISHRGNLNGPKSAEFGENHPASIDAALIAGFDVEIDLRKEEGKLVLGHDKGEYEIEEEFLFKDGLWIHCKNIQALMHLHQYENLNYFSHNEDDVVLTSKKFLWSYPRESVLLTNYSIAVMVELVPNWKNVDICAGICTDFPNN
jgi:hypothetical protein